MKKIMMHIALFILLGIILESALSFCLEPQTMQMEIERQLSYKKKSGVEPVLVILGDSTVGSGIDPAVLQCDDEEIQCALNAASGNQPLEGSYYYLRYLKKEYPQIRKVVLGIAYDQLIDSQTNMKKKLIVLDRIHDVDLWFSYARTFLSVEDIPLLLKSYRYRDEIKNVPENLQSKIHDLLNFTPSDSIGYSPYETKLDPDRGEVGMGSLDWNEQKVDPKSLTALENILQFCSDSGMEVYLVTMPVGDALFYSNQGIGGTHGFIEAIANKYQVLYLDMNLWRQREEENMDEQMADNVHIMHDLSTELSDVIGKIIAGEPSSRYLYTSVQEARQKMHGILHLELSTKPDGNGNRIMTADWICTDGMTPILEFKVLDEQGKILLDSGKQKEKTALLPEEYIGRKMNLTVTAYAEKNQVSYERTFQITVDQHTWEEGR